MMNLISINIGKEQTLVRPGKTEQTGIFKQPVNGPVQVTWQGLPGDFIGDRKHHGGADQAIYVYGWMDYLWWQEKLGRDMQPGLFGENLTIAGLACAHLAIGDTLQIGEVVLQVTAPRIPCGTLAGRMNLPEFVKLFREAERPGAYCRVLREGVIETGQMVRLEHYSEPTVSLLEVMRDYYEPDLSEAAIRRFLSAPLAFRVKKKKEEQLKNLS